MRMRWPSLSGEDNYQPLDDLLHNVPPRACRFQKSQSLAIDSPLLSTTHQAIPLLCQRLFTPPPPGMNAFDHRRRPTDRSRWPTTTLAGDRYRPLPLSRRHSSLTQALTGRLPSRFYASCVFSGEAARSADRCCGVGTGQPRPEQAGTRAPAALSSRRLERCRWLLLDIPNGSPDGRKMRVMETGVAVAKSEK